MSKIFKSLIILGVVVLVCGCAKNISKISYTRFNEYFSSSSDYTIIDHTDKYDIDIRRYIEAGDGNIQYFYIEFDSSKSASSFLKKNYTDYKIKEYKNYSYIKSRKNGYMKLYKIDNVIVIAKAEKTKYKWTLNKVLKKLGY